jgi:hypothetical protein
MGQYTGRHGSSAEGAVVGRYSATDVEASTMFPALLEFLTERETEDGKPRVTSTLSLSAEDGVFKLCLTDRAQKGSSYDYKLWVSGESIQACLGSIEGMLADGSAVWRKFPKWVPRR